MYQLKTLQFFSKYVVRILHGTQKKTAIISPKRTAITGCSTQ
jgi:hypothetical protein